MSRPSIAIALFLGSVMASPASAQSWSDFGSAFQLFPCNDGWSGCRVDGEIVQPDMEVDSEGLPTPAHMRVGWFDLQPTDNFSPFSTLSEYTGELAWDSGGGDAAAAAASAEASMDEEDAVAVVDDAAIDAEMTDEGRAAVAASEEAAAAQEAAAQEREAADQAAAAAKAEQEARKRAEEEARKQAEEQAARAAELERQQKAAEAAAAQDAAAAAEAARLRKEAEAAAKAAKEAEAKRKAEEEARKRAEEEARKREAEAKQKAEAEAKRKAEAEAKRKAEEEARKRAEEEARRKAEEEAARKRAEEEAKRKAAEEAAAANDAAADAADMAPAAAAGGSCELGNLVALEPKAMLGKLDEPTVAACEQTLSAAAKMTDKGKVSRILMVNAFSKGDKATWEKLVKRHLDEIDQSDPDLCYKYALHLSKQGAGRASGVIRWADVALENRTRWTGDTYTSRVFSLYKLRAASAQKLWQAAEAAHAKAPSDDTGANVDKYRAMTKVMAREWYEYAKVSGKDTTKALQLCMSAAGTKDYCEAG